VNWHEAITRHYRDIWSVAGDLSPLPSGPIHQLPADFAVLRFAPRTGRKMWTYATCGMSQAGDARRIELHMHSPRDSASIVELLTITAHYHRTGATLGLSHSVNFGRPWLDESACDHGYVSLPYLDGPLLENLTALGTTAKFYWLIPVTRSEIAFKKAKGVEALERAFEQASFNYLDPARPSVA
jgi:hypothetical protein